MIKKLMNKISAERINPNDSSRAPFFINNQKIREYEKIRKEQALFILGIDKWNTRRFIPMIIKQYLFDILSFLRKYITKIITADYYNNISGNDFIVSKSKLNASIDLIFVCRKPKNSSPSPALRVV